MAENQAETMSCYPMQFPDMVAKKKTIRCALKFKVTTKGIWNVSEDKLCEGTDGPCMVKPSKQKPEMSLDDQSWKKQKMGPFKVKSCEGTDRQRNRVSVGVSKPPEANVPVKPLMPVTSGKRKPEMSFDDQRWKKQKMDCSSKLECSKILKDLMNHSVGWAFSEPVDPVKLKIPDYFQIIRNPMDLGTIKHKLERDKYSAAKEFADDVQLTFKNAMSYNPPEDEVHRWAEMLDGTFRRKWKLLDARLKHTNKSDEKTRKVLEDNHQVMKPAGLMKAIVPEKLSNSRRISLEERQKSRPGIMQAKPGKTAVNGCSSLSRTAEKGPCNRRAPASTNLGQSIDSKLDCEVKCTSTSLANSFALDSEGRGVAYNEDKSPCSTSATTPAFVEGWMADVPMSPKKALRVAMLKSRFADTIFKATHPTLVDNDEKSDPSRIQQERLQLEKEQLKEKARIEAQIKAAEVASRRKQQDELKMRRERERKAARIALEKMEKTVEIDWALSMLRDLDILFGGYPNSKSVEQLGLYLKEKYVEEDDAEDGEIL
ncbi:transcription factor GTE11-like [Salvia miltiorrhiza]|uniref:transcription factor GTE11-like n=1 Tax=Salvia miltiorrhiza TaxID=226208 RepID=UPI0025AC1FF7|nr:transcription factor GTE11-like [Salvia miltiorrhiza]XP_057764112.1 transcription factor GTE11-like [Salvia miltiorrhiza]